MRIVYHHRTRATDAQRVHICEIVRAFRELNHTVEIVGLVDPESPLKDDHDQAAEAWWKSLARRMPYAYEIVQLGYNLVGVPLLLWRVLRGRADFIYERYSLLNFSGVLVGWLTQKPVLLEVNSPLALEQTREREIRAHRLAQWMERVICNAATRVIAISGPLRRILIESGVRPDQVVIMPNGVDLSRLSKMPDVEPLRAQWGLQAKTVIGFVGWFRPWHGLERLVQAFADAHLAQHGAVLLLVGDGPAMADLQARVEHLALQDSVIFAGAISHEKVPELLKLIHIAVQPAANEYCCPMKIIEYMGLGKAIVAPKQENIEELLADGREALLFEPDQEESLSSALKQLVADPELQARLGRGALSAIHSKGLLWRENAARAARLATGRAVPQLAEPARSLGK
jgi:glycosyltransferase involved in cell wall biosynthesis